MVRTMYGGVDFKYSNKNSESNKGVDNRKNKSKNRRKAEKYLSNHPLTELSDNIPDVSPESHKAMEEAKKKTERYGSPKSMLDLSGGSRRRKKRRKSHKKKTKRRSSSRKRKRKRTARPRPDFSRWTS